MIHRIKAYLRLRRIARLEYALEIEPFWCMTYFTGMGEEFFDYPDSEKRWRKAIAKTH